MRDGWRKISVSLYTPQMSEATRTNGGQSWDPGTQCGKDLLRSMELYFCFGFFLLLFLSLSFYTGESRGILSLNTKSSVMCSFIKKRGSHDV